MSAVLRNESLAPMTEGMYLSVVPGRNREKLHKRLGDARSRVTNAVMQQWKSQPVWRHSGAAIFSWSDTYGRWVVVDEIDPGECVPYEEMPWHKTPVPGR